MKARLDSPRNADSVEEQAIKFKIEFSDEVGDAQGKDGRTLQIISNVLERFEGMDSEFCIPTFRIKIRKENGQSDHHQVKREIGSFSCSKELAFNVSGSSQTSMYSLRHFSDLSMEDSQKLHLSSRSLSQIESSKILTRRGLKTMAINGVYKILQDRNATEYVFLQKFGMNALSRTGK